MASEATSSAAMNQTPAVLACRVISAVKPSPGGQSSMVSR